jgi:hypothetical protein
LGQTWLPWGMKTGRRSYTQMINLLHDAARLALLTLVTATLTYHSAEARSDLAYKTVEVQAQHPNAEQQSPSGPSNALPQQKTDRETSDEQRERRERMEQDRRLANYTEALFIATLFLAIATAVLAIATLGLWWFAYQQSRDMKALIATADKTANAAMLNAQAAIGMELPVIRFATPDLEHLDGPIPEQGPYATGDQHGIPTKYSVVSIVTMHNHGRTAAFPTSFSVGWRVVRDLPEIPVYHRIFPCERGSIIREDSVKEESFFQMDIRLTIELTDHQIPAIEAQAAHLWLYVLLQYNDFMGNPHEAGACWRWGRPDTVGIYYFASDGKPPHAYERRT